MGFTIKTTKQAEDAAKFVASAILKKLKEKKRVLFFVTGGTGSGLFIHNSESGCVKQYSASLASHAFGFV